MTSTELFQHSRLSIFTALACRPVTLPIPAMISQNVTTKSCLLCVKGEKYAF